MKESDAEELHMRLCRVIRDKTSTTEHVSRLIAKGAPLKIIQDEYGSRSPLSTATEEGRVDIVRVLLDAGADVNIEVTVMGHIYSPKFGKYPKPGRFPCCSWP